MNFRAAPSGLSRRAAAVLDMTALIDVVFLLLNFFVLTSSMVDQQNASSDVARIDVDLASTTLAADTREYDDLRVSVDVEGKVYVDGEEVATTELGPRFCAAHNDNPETLVLIEADQAVAHGRVAQVMAAAHLCQLRVHMAEGAGN